MAQKQLPESVGRGTHSLEDKANAAVGDEFKEQQVMPGSKVTIPGAETGHISWAEEYRFFMHR
mgnify:FL=1